VDHEKWSYVALPKDPKAAHEVLKQPAEAGQKAEAADAEREATPEEPEDRPPE
jgi:hypothetical protein